MFFACGTFANERYSSIEEYRNEVTKWGCNIEIENIDIDNDGDIDHIVQHTHYDTDPFVSIFVKIGSVFRRHNFERANKYKLIKQNKKIHVRFDFPTYQLFEDFFDPGDYYWHDFYEFNDKRAIQINDQYIDFYKDMVMTYERGIVEEEEKISDKQKKLKGRPEDIIDSITSFNQKQIEKYKQFIQKAKSIISP